MINYDVINATGATDTFIGMDSLTGAAPMNSNIIYDNVSCYPVYPYIPAYPYAPPVPVYYPPVPYYVPYPQRMSESELDDLAERIAKKMREKKARA